MRDANDAVLLERVRGGDFEAFKRLYERYSVVLYRTVLAIVGDRDAAEDVVQETFLRFYRHAHRVDGSSSLGPWLHRVAVNLSYSVLARRSRWKRTFDDVVECVVSRGRWDERDAELRREVRSALRKLPAEQRVVVVLHYLAGFSLQEIAYIVGAPLGTVKSRLYYARQALRQMLLVEEQDGAEVVAYGTV